MSHDTHTASNRNQDLDDEKDLNYYLNLSKGWKDPFPIPVVRYYGETLVVREDTIEVGSKGRFADLLVSRTEEKTLVYVAPRVGYAGISLAHVCRRLGKKLVLFCPSSRQISDHQMRARELGADLRFFRIAAMPNLNALAKRWADENGACFIPLGLKHPLVTAAIVRTAWTLSKRLRDKPDHVWCAISTGVLSRGLQIVWPNAHHHAVAVARNIKEGEKGIAAIYSYPRNFQQPSRVTPPFPCVRTYDAKAWELMVHSSHGENALFWNVAGEIIPYSAEEKNEIDSYRDWGDTRDWHESQI